MLASAYYMFRDGVADHDLGSHQFDLDKARSMSRHVARPCFEHFQLPGSLPAETDPAAGRHPASPVERPGCEANPPLAQPHSQGTIHVPRRDLGTVFDWAGCSLAQDRP